MLPRRILVATDGSEPSRAAEEFAAGIAAMMGECELVLLTCVRHHDIPSPRGLIVEDPSDEELESANLVLSQAEDRVQGALVVESAGLVLAEAENRARAALDGGHVSVRTVLATAHSPALGIIEAAQEGGGCSMIVMGNRGHGGLASVMLGSVSTRVLHEAHCPVLIVKH